MDAFWRTLAAFAAVLVLFAGALTPVALSEPERELLVGLHAIPTDLAPGASLHGGRVAFVNEALRYAVVATTQPKLLALAARLDANVRYVEEDVPVPLLAEPKALAPYPNDALFGTQYALQRIRAPEAWEIARASAGDRVVCVIDSGLRSTHVEFGDGRWLGGWDFVEGDDEPQDVEGHGTHVAGIAVASTGNVLGISGVSGAKFLTARTHSHGWSTTNRTATAMQWCADQGADILSMSFGQPQLTQTAQEGIRYAAARGALLVAAAGNGQNCVDCVNYPAAFPEVVAVTNTNAFDQLHTGSSTGPQAELAAPGVNILSTWSHGDDQYWTESGTSMSAPHVTGVAALVWNYQPLLPASVLRDLLDETARDLGEPGRDSRFGFGVVDARAALEAVWPRSRPVCRILEPARHLDDEAAPLLTGPVTLRAWTASAGSTVASVTAEVGDLRLALAATEDPHVYATTFDASRVAQGVASLTLRCVEQDGGERTHARGYTFG